MHWVGYLDGVRALAAVYVLVFHLLHLSPNNGSVSPTIVEGINRWLPHGQLAVSVFIVLSGYCLMLPSLREPGYPLRGGIGRFFRRRFLRIYPAYFAVVTLTVATQFAFMPLSRRLGGPLPTLPPWHDVAAHLLLVHNLFLDLHATINGALWSVATEWQIYFVFALLLLPVLRRAGGVATVTVAYAIGLLPGFLLPEGRDLAWMHPWYLGLFAVGMVAAAARRPGPWVLLGCVGGVWLAMYALVGRLGASPGPLVESMVGLATAGGLVALRGRQDGRVSGFLSGKAMQRLAKASYTLYLSHLFLLKYLTVGIGILHLQDFANIAFRLCVGVPLCVGVALVAARFLEEPFVGCESFSEGVRRLPWRGRAPRAERGT